MVKDLEGDHEDVPIRDIAVQIKRADSELRKRMGFGISHILDKFMTLDLLCRPVIDVFALDKKLHRIHGDYEKRGLSMSQLIISHYGEEADNFINSLLP